ncbi:MAG TPA: nuclear transport factor 2 family protein [Sunxiuqinia sp.]|nr:nuclear transport factor 2 family protein [Sunxiuqinia sp.]
MSAEDEVRKASKQFYAALNEMTSGDASSLKEIWSHNATVTTMHPIGGRQVGWDEVWKAWDQTAQVASDGNVELQNQLIRVVGDLAYEVGVENATFKIAGNQANGQVRVTNIYQKEGGSWKIVHHHTDVASAMVEALKQLQSS